MLFKCPVCTYARSSIEKLRDHVQLAHHTELTFTCNRCDYESLNRGDLARHYARQHPTRRDEAHYITHAAASARFMRRQEAEERKKRKEMARRISKRIGEEAEKRRRASKKDVPVLEEKEATPEPTPRKADKSPSLQSPTRSLDRPHCSWETSSESGDEDPLPAQTAADKADEAMAEGSPASIDVHADDSETPIVPNNAAAMDTVELTTEGGRVKLVILLRSPPTGYLTIEKLCIHSTTHQRVKDGEDRVQERSQRYFYLHESVEE
ncbi:uncharacterized protein [Diadema antillarum]|uniref:uncharacterized protein n=1 Tax=Diadema antillarum TaxID=105358 RepID=UPI003A8B8A6F